MVKRNCKRMVAVGVAVSMLLCFGMFSSSMASTVNVSTISAMKTAIGNASSGDVIVLANGTYQVKGSITIDKNNITVKAATPGGVYLSDSTVITISGSYVTFSGFQFTTGSLITHIVITVTGSNDTLTQLNFHGYSSPKYIQLEGQHNVVSYCNFEAKPASAPIGNLIHINPDVALPGYHKIRYCSFQKMPGAGGDNGNECIRISNGATSTYVSRTIVEFCYFDSTGWGDSEVISVKCQENVLRYNTNTNNQKGNFCFRNGDYNIAYGNFFINAGGIRVKEANNIYCYNNYFYNCGDGSITAPVKYVYVSPNLKNINFMHNTIIDGTPVELDNSATANTWANNIFKKTSGNIFTGSATGITWAGNIYSGSLGITISSGMTSANPQLALNYDGYYGLTASSTACIDAASAAYPSMLKITNVDNDTLMMDISGQSRPSSRISRDIGCEEYNATGTVINHPLTLADVGPSYLGGPSALPVELQNFTAKAVGGTVELAWSTATEVNNAGFEIERYTAGQAFGTINGAAMFDLPWKKLGFVEGAGTSNAPKQYSFTEKYLESGRYLYRLKQVDRDGKFEYSPEVEVNVSGLPTVLALTGNYPNPFNPSTTIGFTVPRDGRAVVKVFDMLGKEVATVFNDAAVPGKQYAVPFNASALASGVYVSQLEFAGGRVTKQMILLK